MKAIDLEEAIERFIQAGQNMSKDQVIYMLNRIPTTEIIKCQDCKYWGNLWRGSCEHPAAQIADTLHTGPTDFCSYGERSEDE